MINPVSFGSTYKMSVNNHSSVKKQMHYRALTQYCEENELPYQTKVEPIFMTSTHPEEIYTLTAVLPDKDDINFEMFCKNRGIKVEKFENENIMTPRSILKRIKNPPKGYIKAYVDAEKISKFLEKQRDNNFKHCKHDYDMYYKNKTDFMLKSFDFITAPTLHVNSPMGTKEALEYIRKYGSKMINEDSVMVNLDQRTDDPDHCLYFAMQDAGLKQIPVYVNRTSLELGRAIGFIE